MTIEQAKKLLDGYAWELYTCDAGYGCKVYVKPEDGGALLGEGFGHSLQTAISNAVIDMRERACNP